MRSRGVTNLRSSSVTKLPAPESWPPDAWHVPPAPVAPDSRSLVSRLSIRLEARWTGRMKSRAWEGPGRSRGEGCVIASHCPLLAAARRRLLAWPPAPTPHGRQRQPTCPAGGSTRAIRALPPSDHFSSASMHAHQACQRASLHPKKPDSSWSTCHLATPTPGRVRTGLANVLVRILTRAAFNVTARRAHLG